MSSMYMPKLKRSEPKPKPNSHLTATALRPVLSVSAAYARTPEERDMAAEVPVLGWAGGLLSM